MECTTKAVKTLDKINPNTKVRIKDIGGGWGLRQRLLQLGLHIGDKVSVVRGGSFGGPILISYNYSNIAIGRGIAKKIMVVTDNDQE